jgi:hypothetical protein
MVRRCSVHGVDNAAETMTRAKLIRYVVIPLAAILAFWWGGYFYFRGSSDWQEVQALIFQKPEIRARVGEIKQISVGPFPFMYRFSGDYAKATLRVTVTGTNGEYQATIDAERRGGIWALVS